MLGPLQVGTDPHAFEHQMARLFHVLDINDDGAVEVRGGPPSFGEKGLPKRRLAEKL